MKHCEKGCDLKKRGLIFELEQQKTLEEQLLTILKDSKKMNRWKQSIQLYQKEIELEVPEEMVEVMTWFLEQKTKNIPSHSIEPSTIFQVVRA